MIGKFLTGKSFRGCLLYCLNDKQQKQGEQAIKKQRAEVLLFNQCYGTQKDLIAQFNETRGLNTKLNKPVLHITLSISPEDKLTHNDWSKVAMDCAHEMGFAGNQFVAVLHNDTDHPHIHIIANRIGFDKKTVSDSNSYRRMAEYCRKMEQKYKLEQVLSPRQFLPKEIKNLPRIDERKQAIKYDVGNALFLSNSYVEFESCLKQKKYEIIKGRGIAFVDPKKVYVKGSEIGFSLATIEKLLAKSPDEKKQILNKKQQQEKTLRQAHPKHQKISLGNKGNIGHENISKALEMLLRAEEQRDQVPNQFLPKKRKKKSQSLHL